MANTIVNDQTRKSLTKFVDVFKKLNNTIDKYNRFQPWLVFKLINQYEGAADVTVLTIDTFTAVGTVNLPGVGTQRISNIMLTNFEYNKNGAGKANTFTLSFAFNPEDKPEAGGSVTAPGLIDKALTISSYYVYDGDSKTARAINSMNKHKCYMRYGYNFGDTDLQSPEYYGQALKANSELRDGLIYYTITGYSSLTYLADLKVSFSAIGSQDGTGGVKASKAVAAVLYSAFGGGDNFSLQGNSYSIDGGNFIKSEDVNKLRETTNKLYPGITVKIINEVEESQENEIYIPESNNENIFTYISRILSLASLTINSDREDTSKATLTYSIDEKDKELIFRIYIDDPTEDTLEQQSKDLTADIVYRYPDKGNNVVKSFTPDFNFEIFWSQDIFNDDNYNTYDLSREGSLVGGKDYNNTKQQVLGNASISTFSKAVQYAYTADMTTVGIPADIPIGTIIKVAPIINGQEYHYSGNYMVKSTTDRIDTMGYTTNYSLIKIVPKREASNKNPDENLGNVLPQEAKDDLIEKLKETNAGAYFTDEGELKIQQGPVAPNNSSGSGRGGMGGR